MTVNLSALRAAIPDSLTSHRLEASRVDLLTRVDGVVGPLDGVESCSVTVDASGLIPGDGQLSLRDVGQEIKWSSARVQPWIVVNDHSWPLGVFLLSAPTTQYDEEGRSWSVSLLDKVTILDSDLIDVSYSVATGANIVEAVVAVIKASGEMNTQITPSTATVSEPGLTWPMGTSRLTIVNDLLKALNYQPVRADAYGALYSGPDTDPALRPVTREFIAGRNAIHEATFEVQRDLATVPNRVICLWQASSETETQKAVAEDHDPNSPTSYENRGRWVTKVYDNEEADSQATLDAIALKYLREEMAPRDTVVFSHAAVPIEIGDVVRFVSADLDILGEVQRSEASIGVGELTRTTIRRLVATDGV